VQDGRGHRLQWDEVPAVLRARLAEVLGADVVVAEGQRGGYGPGLAARCGLDDGRRVFIKAVSSAQNPDTPAMVRREVAIARVLPTDVPAPALLHVVDDGEWVALVFEEVAGTHPQEPWVEEELRLVLTATSALGRHRAPPGLATVAEHFGRMLRGWRTLRADAGRPVSDLWCRAHLAELAELEVGWEAAAAGDRLVHGDVRSDNVLLTPAGGVVFVDWTSTCAGASWFDAVLLLPSVTLAGGSPPEALLALAGLDVDVERLRPVVAALAGYFVERGGLPDPPGLPTVRAFQRAQADVTVAWLRRMVEV
jgi:aminoglycoside phosphotransferase (APT) family kinase protein